MPCLRSSQLTLMGFKIYFFCIVCKTRVTILEGLLFKLSSNEYDGSSVPNTFMLLCSPAQHCRKRWRGCCIDTHDKNTSHPLLPPYFRLSWWTTLAASIRYRAHTRTPPWHVPGFKHSADLRLLGCFCPCQAHKQKISCYFLAIHMRSAWIQWVQCGDHSNQLRPVKRIHSSFLGPGLLESREQMFHPK